MNAVLQLSRQEPGKSIETKTTWLSKRIYAASQGLVDDLLADIASLNAQIFSEDLSVVMLLAEESFRTMSPLYVEYRIQHPSHGARCLSANFMPVVQGNGGIQWHGFIKEITERWQMENVLTHLYKVLDSIADPAFVKDREHRWIFLNDAYCQMIGHDRDELIGKTDFDFFPEQEAKVLWEKDEEVFHSGQENINEENLTDSDGNKQTILTKKTRYTDSHWQHFIVGIISNITERKQVLIDKQRLLTIMDESVDYIGIGDLQGNLLYHNRAALNMVGLPEDFDLSAMHVSDMRPAWAAKIVQEIAIPTALAQGMWRGETALLHRDGREIPVTQLVLLHRGADGQPEFLSTVMQDISERKQMEALLASHERGFRAMIENASDNIARYDRDLRFLYVNPTLEKTLGQPAATLIGLRPVERYPDSLVMHEYQKVLEQVVKTGQAAEYLMISGQDSFGRTLYDNINIAPEFAVDGSVQGIIVIGRDLTSTRQLEMKIAERERELHALIENTPDVIIRYDISCRRTWINQNYERVYGNPVSAAFGKKPTESWGKPRMAPEEYERLLHEVMVSGVPRDIELDWFTPYGEYICQSVRAVPEYDGNGVICSVLSFTRDVSELKRTELRLEDTHAHLATVLQTIPDIVWMKNLDGIYLTCNSAFEPLFGAKEADIVGKTDFDFMGVESAMLCKQSDMEAIAADTVCISEEWVTLADDQRLALFEVRKVPVHGTDGNVIGVLGIGRDITERRQMEIALQTNEQEFRTLIDNSPDMIIRYDTEYHRVFVNPAYLKTIGISQEDALGNMLADSWLPENISSADYQSLLQQVMDSGESSSVVVEWQRCDNVFISHDMRIVPEYDVNGRVNGTLVIGHDISRLRRADFELIKREQEFRVLVEHSPDTINRYDRECRRIYANPRMQIDAGMPLDEIMFKTPEECPSGEQAAAYQEKIRQVLGSGEASQFELTWRTRNSKEMCSLVHLSPEFDPEGQIISVLAVGRDITEIAAYRKQIHKLAFFDPLTNLPNRSLLSDHIRQAVADAARHGQQFGLMMIDLDRFKEINDTLGHSVGDQVLSETAERLQKCVRSYDTVARLGGDEFAILFPEIRSGLDLDIIASKILFAFNHPFMVDGKELFVSGSIGIALYPDDSIDIGTLFRYADSAMYHAKQQGRNNFQFYSADFSEKSARRMTIENDLRKAQERNELELYYQPQVELASGKIIGAEALLRWNHGKKGMITPDKFIPVAEETGLIVGIGEWVLHSACLAAVAWNTNREIPLCIAVNLSTRQFIRNDLVGTVQRILKETACNPLWIKLEITESLLLEDSTEIAAMLDTFNLMGHAISIDDFGTGYSALSYLNRFPVSQIKIDRSFVKDIPNDHNKTELVKVMISISQVLDMELVAEGVETQEQADCLLSNGCTVAQGYLFGKPLPYAAFEALIAIDVVFCLGEAFVGGNLGPEGDGGCGDCFAHGPFDECSGYRSYNGTIMRCLKPV